MNYRERKIVLARTISAIVKCAIDLGANNTRTIAALDATIRAAAETFSAEEINHDFVESMYEVFETTYGAFADMSIKQTNNEVTKYFGAQWSDVFESIAENRDFYSEPEPEAEPVCLNCGKTESECDCSL